MNRRLNSLEQQVSTIAAKVDMVIEELKEQREDMRRLQDRQDAAQAQHNADMKELREDIKGTLRHIQGLTIASMVGIGAIAIATWVFVLTGARNETPHPPAPSAQVEMKSADVADK